MSYPDAIAVVAMVGAASVGITFIARLVIACYRLARRVEAVHDAVLTELMPNGGSTLVDRVALLETDFAHHRHEQHTRWQRLEARLGMPGHE